MSGAARCGELVGKRAAGPRLPPVTAPSLLVLNQTLGHLAWELTEDLAHRMGPLALLTASGSERPPPGVSIHPATPYNRGSYGARIWSWTRYTLRAIGWVMGMPRGVPVVLFSNPPILPWIGGLLCRWRRQPYAVVVLDIYPDILVRLGKLDGSHPVVRLWWWMNRHAYERARVVVTLGDRMAENLGRQFDPTGTRFGSVAVMWPWADTRSLRPIEKAKNSFAHQHGQASRLTVMYSGNMGIGHDVDTMLATAERLRDVDGIGFMCIGGGARWREVEKTIRERSLANVTLLEWQSSETFPLSLAAAEIAVVTLEPGMGGLALPSKVFSSLAVGSAIVAICADDSEMADIVRRFRCGWVIRPGDVGALEAILRGVVDGTVELEEMRKRSRVAAERIGSRENSARAAEMLSGCLAGNGLEPASP